LTAPWTVSLPMYAGTQRLRHGSRALLAALVAALQARGWTEVIEIVDAPDDLPAHWLAPRLLLSQTCGYPLMTALHGRVRLVAVPAYDAEGCTSSARYASRIIVRTGSGAQSLDNLRGASVAVNNADSHSGMNALRHAVAPLASGGRFFGRVLLTGGHAASVQAVRDGRADVAAIDPVTWQGLQDDAPDQLTGLRTLQWTAVAPGLPLVASRTLAPGQVALLRQALADVAQAQPALLQQLRIRSFLPVRWRRYDRILALEQQAVAQGYADLVGDGA